MPEITRHEDGMFSYSDLQTTDERAALDFYTRLFGWSVDEQPMGEGQTYYMFQKNGKVVGAAARQQDHQRENGVPPMWNTYFTVSDVDLKAKEVERAGGTVLAPPFDVFDAGRMAVVSDPAGGVLSIWQAKESIGAEVMHEANTLTWTELHSTDRDRARTFYTDVFGWTHEDMDMGGGVYTVFSSGGNPVCGLFDQTSEGMPSFWLVYFDVDDCKATTEQAQAMGARVMMGPENVPTVGVISVLTDPQGAGFGLLEPERPAS